MVIRSQSLSVIPSALRKSFCAMQNENTNVNGISRDNLFIVFVIAITVEYVCAKVYFFSIRAHQKNEVGRFFYVGNFLIFAVIIFGLCL